MQQFTLSSSEGIMEKDNHCSCYHTIYLLAQKTIEALKENKLQAIEKLVQDYSSLWNILSGIPLIGENVVALISILTSLFQLRLVFILKGYVVNFPCKPVAEFNSVLLRLCRFLNLPSEDTATALKPLLVSLQYEYPGIYRMLLRLSLILVLLESPCDVAADVSLIIKILSEHLELPKDICIDIFSAVIEIKVFLEQGDISLERMYMQAWKHFQAEQYIEALRCMVKLDPHGSTSISVSYLKLLQANCLLLLDRPNLSLIAYHQCIASANQMVMKSAISNCCFLFRNYNYHDELRLRLVHNKSIKTMKEDTPLLLARNGEGSFSHFPTGNIDYIHDTLYTGLRALNCHKPHITISMISEGLKKGDSIQQPSLWYLLSIKALYLCGDYLECWKKLCEFFNFIKSSDDLVAIFQLCFLGSTTAFHLHKIKLARYLGYLCVKVGNFLKVISGSKKMESWICYTQAKSFVLLCKINVGLKRIERARKCICAALCISTSPSLFVLHTHCLLCMNEKHLKDCASNWIKLYQKNEELVSTSCINTKCFNHLNSVIKKFYHAP